MTSGDVPGFTADAQRIVERWNPDGIGRWRGGGSVEPRAVRVVAVRGVDTSRVLAALASHAQAADASDAAALVVFVLDHLSVLGRDELSVLDAETTDVDLVLFTMSDDDDTDNDAAALPGDVRGRDEALLRAHSPRFAGARILDRSDLLRAAREAVDEPSGVIGDRNRRRGAVSLVEQTCRLIAETATAIRDDDAAALRERRTRLLAERGTGRAELSAQVRADVQRTRIDLVHAVGVRTRELSTVVRTALDRAGRRELTVFPDRFAHLAAAVTSDIDTVTGDRLDDLGRRAGVTGGSVAPGGPASPMSPPEPRYRGVEDRMMVIVGASAGVGLGRLAVAPLSMVPALDIATIPVTLALGGAAAWWLARSRRLVADRAHLRQWASDATAGLRAQLEQRVLARLLETEAAVGARVIADGRAAAATADAEIASIDAEIRRVGAQRGGRLAACERDRAALVEVLAAFGNAGNMMEPSG
ncbi:hypothetical protein C8K36_109129 [Rhodococcus sp. OK519]|uniref:hypothetical protein n=1 Tax=Rhodococcus sp. OK519 TaxID=2135729 RepID=UPI000D361121|nr:hypothetical protein C8K36_109129 [Rhodococcus sp. OK519]